MLVLVVVSRSWTVKSWNDGVKFRKNIIENNQSHKVVIDSLIGSVNQAIVDKIY